MRLLPTNLQWRRCSLLSKDTSVNFWLTIAGLVLTIIGLFLPFLPDSSDSILAAQHELLRELNVQTEPNDQYGLSALRLGDVYEKLPEAQRFLEALKWHRRAMIEGNTEAEKHVLAAYRALLDVTVDTRRDILGVYFVLDEANRLVFFEYFVAPPEALKKDITYEHSISYTTPNREGKYTFISCIDLMDIVREADESDNCKWKTFTVSG